MENIVSVERISSNKVNLKDEDGNVLFYITSDGTIYNNKDGSVLNTNINNGGYPRLNIDLKLFGKKEELVSRIVWSCFNNYKLQDGEQIHHRRGNKHDNSINNIILARSMEEHTKYQRIDFFWGKI